MRERRNLALLFAIIMIAVAGYFVLYPAWQRHERDAELARLNAEVVQSQAKLEAAHKATLQAQANVGEIDGLLYWLQEKRAEDPEKADRLANMCSASTGLSVGGENALAVAKCVKAAW